MDYRTKYDEWINSSIIDEDTKNELKAITDEKEIEDRFYKDLEFGTGGLRGVIGAGSNRMNIYTVGLATQGFANYLNNKFKGEISVSIAHDSRIKSDVFAKRAATILAANGIKVNLFDSLRPVPELSFSVRELKCKGGIAITASHNPKQYNGYKVYGPEGYQVTDADATAIIDFVNKVTSFADIKTVDFDEAIKNGMIKIVSEEVDKPYVEAVKSATIRKELIKEKAKDLKIIYTPIHGTGNIPVRRVLTELGYTGLNVVKEQELPDGNFPTAPYPNPEDPKVFKLALEMAKEISPDIIFGTDPDADRIGVVVKDSKGEYQILSGNQTGVLLTHYILSSLKELNQLKDNSVVIKTIVTSEMARKVCEDFNVEIMDVLTGFKYIGEKITQFEKDGSHTYVFGFEESYGSLIGTHARDKDAVVTAALVCEMTLYYKNKGLSLYDAFIELGKKYGFYQENLVSIELQGKEGQEKISKCLDQLRKNPVTEVNGVKVATAYDYKESVEKDLASGKTSAIDLPKSNVLKYVLEDGSWFVVRPSGTEPKMKAYIAVVGNSVEDAKKKVEVFKEKVMAIINKAMA
ncbi:phospho-sugar mutase [uncultured Clostridium sp.]|uniref:phospho-sugar mutase n=1 Tax=uncultured Clostridium sp. TaxID=59620 RepID=UPI0025D3D5EB|nr:phospho-sugar mutase [uncultured Clostridium sp.]